MCVPSVSVSPPSRSASAGAGAAGRPCGGLGRRLSLAHHSLAVLGSSSCYNTRVSHSQTGLQPETS